LRDLAQEATRWETHPLFLERLQLLKKIVEMNNLLLPRIRGMMAVSAAELVQIREGRVAVAGYYPAPPRNKGASRGVG